jgi:hypothetical protein
MQRLTFENGRLQTELDDSQDALYVARGNETEASKAGDILTRKVAEVESLLKDKTGEIKGTLCIAIAAPVLRFLILRLAERK